jgi:hypothetical protein
MKPPFQIGDIVRSKANDHFGDMRVSDVRWIDHTLAGVPHYWLVEADEIREPVDLSAFPPGTCGIIMGGSFCACADEFYRV